MTTPDPDHAVVQGREFLAAASAGLARLQAEVQKEGTREAEARDLLRLFRRAMDWMEDSPEDFFEAHHALDEAGRWVRSTFGCTVTQEDGSYWRTCPVDLAHHRVGLSPALVIGASECSICGSEYASCEHIKGYTYDGEMCTRLITEIEAVLEVSFVDKPTQPDARIERIQIDDDDLRRHLGEDFYPGVALSCEICLQGCQGLKRWGAGLND